MIKSLQSFLSILIFLSISFSDVVAQVSKVKPLDKGYYVVVGVFKVSDNARRYSEALSQKGITASCGINPSNEMNYVFVGSFLTRDAAVEKVWQVRKDTAFHDAWVKPIGVEIDTIQQPDVLLASTSTENFIQQQDSSSFQNNEEIIQNDQITLENTEVFLSLFNATNNRVIDGKVKVIDVRKNKLVAEVDGNKYLKLPSSVSGAKKLILICEITGYRKTQLEINYLNPLEEKDNPNIELFGTTVLVNFNMVPYIKGDIITLYNVYFYNDASVMQPESKYELNQVVQMMKDNPEQRIRLHGHTNGNYTGKIISMGPEKNYFSLQAAQNHFGTARELAEERAQIIKEYLIDNDIDKNRIETKSWGGKRPLFDRHSTRAKLNVRVEVEVL